MINIKGIGHYHIISEISKAKGSIVCHDFMERLVIQIAKQSKKHIDITGEAPYSYSEKQLHSILAPAFSSYCDAFLMELPVNRLWSKKKSLNMVDSHGWIDYWARFRNVDFFIELKHNYLSYKKGTIREESSKSWKKAIDQLDSSKHLAKEYGKYSKGSFLVALHALTIYDSSSDINTAECIGDSETLLKIQETYINKLKPKSNWTSLIMFNRNTVINSIYEVDNGIRLYPGLLIMARISEILE